MNNQKATLIIKDYIVNVFPDQKIDLILEITNKSAKSIFILKATENNFALPDFYEVLINPEISLCEIWIADIKPVSFLKEIKPNIKETFIYEDVYYGECEENKGKIFEFNVNYKFDSSNPEIMNKLKKYYENEPEIFEQMKNLTNLDITSNKVEIKIPKD